MDDDLVELFSPSEPFRSLLDSLLKPRLNSGFGFLAFSSSLTFSTFSVLPLSGSIAVMMAFGPSGESAVTKSMLS